VTPAESPFDGERVAKRIARSGVCSRRDAERLIAQGRVAVDGEVITSPALNITAEQRVTVDDKPIPGLAPVRLFRLHKPMGVISAARDPEGRRTIDDLVRHADPALPRLMPIGRLDINSEGLLLLTNDGELKRRLELPSTGWLRRYRVRAYGTVPDATLADLKNGITIDGLRYGSILARLESRKGANAWYSLGLKEGKNREIRRVLEHLGLQVSRLIRVAYGPFQLGALPPRMVEELTGKVLREQLGKKLTEGLHLPVPPRRERRPSGAAKEAAEEAAAAPSPDHPDKQPPQH